MSRLARMLVHGNLHAAVAPPELAPTMTRGAWMWKSGMAIDFDGAPEAYALPGSGLIGLDSIANAGTPPHWAGLVCDPSKIPPKPYVQGPNDPAPGFAVSSTALGDHSRANSDPRRYVDASTFPYVVVPPELHAKGVRLGDVAMVLYAGNQCAAIVADVGPPGHYGEGSPELARELGIADGRHGGAARGVTFIIFPGSLAVPAWPRELLSVQAAATRLYSAWLAAGGPLAAA